MNQIKKVLRVITCAFVMQTITFQSYAMINNGDVEGNQGSSLFPSTVIQITSFANKNLHRLCCNLNPIPQWLFEEKIFDFYELKSVDEAGMVSFIDDYVNVVNVNQPSGFNIALLHAACAKGHIDVVTRLLDLGAAVNELKLDENRNKLTSGRVYESDMISFDKSSTPLILAAKKGHANVVSTLLRHGAKIEETDGCGRTALLAASSFGDIGTVSTLLNAEANIHATCDKFTALDFATSFRKFDIAILLAASGVTTKSAIAKEEKNVKSAIEKEQSFPYFKILFS
ncbi:MAG: ankyrin repeat domain-containing protein [Pseudomonadota bacterium]